MSLAPSTVSIHAFRGEGDRWDSTRCSWHAPFQSTPSGGKATRPFRSTTQWPRVSIHAFRGEGDRHGWTIYVRQSSFNPRLPGGRRPATPEVWASLSLFQSTPSGGKATAHQPRTEDVTCFNPRLPGGRRPEALADALAHPDRFNPRLPGGRRPSMRDAVARRVSVSIHAFRGEGDNPVGVVRRVAQGFNPRLPGGRRLRVPGGRLLQQCFNPRLPGGRRLARKTVCVRAAKFQSTPSGGKATTCCVWLWYRQIVSIHAFRGEGDRRRSQKRRLIKRFNPRLPGGRRQERRRFLR